jgi:pilus assembly protein CpaB
MRAVSVPVTATSGIAGFVFAGDKVDLILTHVVQLAQPGEKERQASETILREIR